MKKLLCEIIAVVLISLFVFVGCGDVTKTEVDGIYNFLSYECEEVFDIEQIDLGGSLKKKCVSYKLTYISDGYKVKAYISMPLAVVENQSKGKCILYNRGGNSKIALLEDKDTARLCVATNRIVIASQYRGAGGGEGKDEFGGSDLNDVVTLIDLCESQFTFVDMNDFCVAGVSRGGMMSYMTARQDDRVKRIIAISAVSDLFKAYEEREDMQKVLYNYIGATPEQAPDEYKNRSAVYWADEIDAPVLIIHSKYDEQVSFAQAEDLYKKLKQTNTDVSFVARDDGVHGLSKDDNKVILNWLDS